MSVDWSNQTILSRFRVDMRLPGETETFRAWDHQTKQTVILQLLPSLPDDETFHQYEKRARELSQIVHPGIAPTIGFFEFALHAFWVEGLADGPTLRDVLKSMPGQPLPLDEALIYLKSLSAAVTALHSAGWAHADLRPENIRISNVAGEGKAVICELIGARRLGERPPAITRYTPLERVLTPAFDVYALGHIFYEMLAGGLPIPLPDLRKLNPKVPEFLARQLPRALDAYSSTRIDKATEFFLTVCLACRTQAESVPELFSGLDSPTAVLLETWEFLPMLEPPPLISTGDINAKKSSPFSAWIWPLVALASLGLGILGWNLLGSPNQLPAQIFSPTTATPSPNPEDPFIPSKIPTITPVPSLEAPDGLGGRIVFTCTRNNLNQLCMVAPTGGKVALITSENSHNYYPAFSPAGDALLYASNRDGSFELYIKLLGSDLLTQVTNGIGEVSSAAFSSNGDDVVFSNSIGGRPSELWEVRKDGKNPQKLYAGAGNIASPVWAPNGQNIAFAMSSAEDLKAYDVYIFDPATQSIGPITKGRLPNAGGSVDWSPDGRSLLLFAGPTGNRNIFLFDIVSGHIRQLTNGGNNAGAMFSPDGRWIVFSSQRKGNLDLFIMKTDGSDVRQITTDPEPDWQPRWGR